MLLVLKLLLITIIPRSSNTKKLFIYLCFDEDHAFKQCMASRRFFLQFECQKY